MRGPTSRQLGDGGEQEWELANNYGTWQRAMAVGYTQTSRLLGRIADSYRSDANDQDGHARIR